MSNFMRGLYPNPSSHPIDDDRLSVYIPYVNSYHNDKTVYEIFNEADIGEVNRVDFIPHKQTDGYEMFVHFMPYYSDIMSEIIQKHSMNDAYRINIPGNEQWIICRNNKPVPDTKMNIHQVAKHSKELDYKLRELRKALNIIPELTTTLHTLNARIKYLEDPEWLNDVSSPLTMDDLSNVSQMNDNQTRPISYNNSTPASPIDNYAPITPTIDWSTRTNTSFTNIPELNDDRYYSMMDMDSTA